MGYGECSDCWSPQPHGIVGTIKDLTPLLLGQDPRPYERRLWDLLYSTRQSPGGIAAKAIAGIECALVDIKAKALGISVVELFGGRCASVSASTGPTAAPPGRATPSTSARPPINTLADIAALGREVVQRGFTALKTNVVIPREQSQAGFGELPASAARCAARIRSSPRRCCGTSSGSSAPSVTPWPRRGHQPRPQLSLQARERPRGLPKWWSRFALLWLEVDMYDPAGIRQIKEATTTKICTGENLFHPREYLPYFEQRAADVFMVDVPWNGLARQRRSAI